MTWHLLWCGRFSLSSITRSRISTPRARCSQPGLCHPQRSRVIPCPPRETCTLSHHAPAQEHTLPCRAVAQTSLPGCPSCLSLEGPGVSGPSKARHQEHGGRLLDDPGCPPSAAVPLTRRGAGSVPGYWPWASRLARPCRATSSAATNLTRRTINRLY